MSTTTATPSPLCPAGLPNVRFPHFAASRNPNVKFWNDGA